MSGVIILRVSRLHHFRDFLDEKFIMLFRVLCDRNVAEKVTERHLGIYVCAFLERVYRVIDWGGRNRSRD